jgi:hypothetical protein
VDHADSSRELARVAVELITRGDVKQSGTKRIRGSNAIGWAGREPRAAL